jgi:oxysterol-binding protein 1
VFDKPPYPDNWEWQYGMSNFTMQLNYFPSWLDKYLPPTDTRRRPDQRFLEHGELVKAAREKDRLEQKQRAVRKWREDTKTEHVPAYFKQWKNPHDGDKEYWVYNHEYWGRDRKNLDWSRLPDLFTEAMPFE